jgi:MFS family permease
VAVERRALRYLIIGGAFAGFGMTSISSFLSVFIQRVHHLGVRDAGALYGTISGVSIAVGLLAGAFASDWLAQKDRRWSAWIATVGLFCAPFVYFVAFQLEDITTAAVLLTAAAAVLLLFYGAVRRGHGAHSGGVPERSLCSASVRAFELHRKLSRRRGTGRLAAGADRRVHERLRQRHSASDDGGYLRLLRRRRVVFPRLAHVA